MARERALDASLMGAVIVWVGILLAVVLVVDDAELFAWLLSILGGGAVWFVLIVPIFIRRQCGGDASR
jgi:hypothetical protein